jgi:hypothetical protein
MIGKELRNGFRLGHRLRADVFEEPDHDAAKSPRVLLFLRRALIILNHIGQADPTRAVRRLLGGGPPRNQTVDAIEADSFC